MGPDDIIGPDQDLESVLEKEFSGNRVFLVVEGDDVVGILVAGEALEAVREDSARMRMTRPQDRPALLGAGSGLGSAGERNHRATAGV